MAMLPAMRWIGGLILIAGCGSAEVEPRFRTAEVERRGLVKTVEANGEVAASGVVAVLPGVEARLSEVMVDESALVREGQLLARLESDQLRQQLAGAKAATAAASAEVERAQLAVRSAEQELERGRKLGQRGQMSKVTLGGLRAQLEERQLGLRVARAQLQEAKAGRARAEWAVAQTEVRAPKEGIVLSAPVRVGDVVSPRGPPLFVVASPLTQVQVQAQVGEDEVTQLRVGQTGTVEADAFPEETFSAEVQSVGVMAQPSQGVSKYSVNLVADNPKRRLLPGMRALVRFEVASVEQALVVREAALRFLPQGYEVEQNQRQVFVVQGNGLKRVPVQVGLRSGGYAEIQPASSTLRPGDELAIGVVLPGAGANKPAVTIGGR